LTAAARSRRIDIGRNHGRDHSTAPLLPAFAAIYNFFDPIALPALRFVMSLVLFPHGCQKLFGWFAGAGFEEFVENFDKNGWHPAVFWVALVALTEA